jgi:hypothetical protein
MVVVSTLGDGMGVSLDGLVLGLGDAVGLVCLVGVRRLPTVSSSPPKPWVAMSTPPPTTSADAIATATTASRDMLTAP